MKLYSPSTIAEIRERHNFQLSKSLGQNFITDRGVIEKIAEGAGIAEGDLVIEIGPGIGVLTAEAAKYAAKVVAIEIDKKLIPILEETLSDYDNVEVINQD
ncbi:MAG: rRNA adenine N-6-methyltransferase family protein, partial [Anaerovoracaceae bacterium]